MFRKIVFVIAFLFSVPTIAQQLDILVVLDNSGSMRKTDANRLVPNVIEELAVRLQALPPSVTAQIGWISYDQKAQLLQPLTPIQEVLDRGLSVVLPYNGQLTNTPAGIERGLYELSLKRSADPTQEDAHLEVIILITDGIIDLGDEQQDQAAKRWLSQTLIPQAKENGVIFYSVALTEQADFQLLSEMGRETQGQYYRLLNVNQLNPVIDQISQQLKNKMSEQTPATPLIESLANQPPPNAPSIEAVTKIAKSNATPANRPAPIAQTQEPQALPPVVPENLPPRLPLNSPTATNTTPSLEVADQANNYSLIKIMALVFILLGLVIIGLSLSYYYQRDLGFLRHLKPALAVTKIAGKIKTNTLEEYFPSAYLVDLHGTTDQPKFCLKNKHTMITRLNRAKEKELDFFTVPKTPVGRQHAIIVYHDYSFWIIDQDSVNGTFINDQRIHQERRLKHGDRIRFHTYEFEFNVADLVKTNETLVGVAYAH